MLIVTRAVLGLAAVLSVASPAMATFHFMQVEKIIGGVNGDTNAQAIQLRMRSGGQHLVAQSRLRAWDSAGANPVLLLNITTDLPGPSSTGDQILLTTTSFNVTTSPTADPDFTLAAAIPASYLAAGSLTFESDAGSVVWRVSWGGGSYTGSNSGTLDNDADGNFGPPFAGPLPSSGTLALQFTGSASAPSTNNAANYALSAGDAVLTNYDNTPFTVQPPQIPAVSEWGVLLLALSVCCAATLALRGGRAGTARLAG